MKISQIVVLSFTCLLGMLPVATSAKPFVVSADGEEVTDQNTGLIWRRCAEGMSWNGATCKGTALGIIHEAALARAKEIASSTAVAWRLPNVKELASIADKSLINPAIDDKAFPAIPPQSVFWSASPNVGDPACAWYVHFNDGVVNSTDRRYRLYVRLVRAGQ